MPAILPRQLQPCCIQRSDNGCQVCEASRLQQRVLAWQSSTRVKHEIRQKNLPWSPRIPVQKAVLDKLPANSKGSDPSFNLNQFMEYAPARARTGKTALDACLFISKARSFFWCSNDLDGWTLCRIGPFSHNVDNMLPPCYTISFTLHMVF